MTHHLLYTHPLRRLLPGLKQLADEVADPECREVAAASYATLLRIETEAEEVQRDHTQVPVTLESLLAKLREVRGVGKCGEV